ncbi:MAG: ABC transporter permease [Caldilineaceae bacterium]|nr:ABC transporter permease [Caldilineaceae bacterium]
MAYLEDARSRSRAEPTHQLKRPPVKWPQALEKAGPQLLLLGGLLLWEGSVAAGWLSSIFFPAPTLILKTLGQLLVDGALVTALAATLLRLWTGLLLGGGAGIMLGLLMGWSPRLYRFCNPFVAALHPLPKIAILPLFMIIFGMGDRANLALIAVSSFFPLLINTVAGVQQISPIYWEVAHSYGATHRQLIRRVLLPGSLPLLLTGFRLALNTALIITLSVELLTTQSGVGSLIWLAWQTMRLPQLYAALVVIVLMGIGFQTLLTWLTQRLVPWQQQVSL